MCGHPHKDSLYRTDLKNGNVSLSSSSTCRQYLPNDPDVQDLVLNGAFAQFIYRLVWCESHILEIFSEGYDNISLPCMCLILHVHCIFQYYLIEKVFRK